MTDAVSTPQAEAPSITLQDLQNLLQIIDVSAERGTFRGSELSSVGMARDKLSAFLTAAKEAEEAQAEAAEGTDEVSAPDAVEAADEKAA